MKILGVDPGLSTTGYGVISVCDNVHDDTGFELLEAGIIRTDGARQGVAARLRKVHDSLEELIEDVSPDVLVIEKLFTHYKHPATAILMGHARGVVCLLSGTKDIPLVSMPCTHVKKAVTGRGHASKKQVQRMIQHILGLGRLPEPSDVADALAIAVAYAFNRRLKAKKKKNPE